MTPGGELTACYRCSGLGTLPDHHGEGRVQCPRCHDGAHLGEQSPTAEDLEIDRLRAEVRSLAEKKLELKREVSDLIGKLAAVRLDEREACAALLETMAAEQAAVAAPFVDPFAIRVHAMTVRAHAALIRARGGK